MKKLMITSVVVLSAAASANASVYLNWDSYDAETNPSGMVHVDKNNPAPGAEHNFSVLQNAVNQNAVEFDRLNQVAAGWNNYLFGENGDMSDGLFWSYYVKDGGVQKRLAALENTSIKEDMESGFSLIMDDMSAGFAAIQEDVVTAFGCLADKIHDMDKDLSAGIASTAALSSVAVSNVSAGEVSVGGGYGYHNGQSAAAFGFAVGLTDAWSMNAGAGFSSADTTFRAGTNYKFKLF